jgi:predicted DNA-binding protein
MAVKKPAQSFRLGDEHRLRLEEIATFRGESQVEVLRTLIDVGYKEVKKRKQQMEALRA